MKMKALWSFVIGVSTGVGASIFFFKKKYEAKAVEEIELMRSYYESRKKALTPLEPEVVAEFVQPEEPNKIGTISFKTHRNYVDYSNAEVEEQKDPELSLGKPYIIDDSEFGMEYEECCTLYYFVQEDLLTDDTFEIIDNVEEAVGKQNLLALKNGSEEVICVRNEKRQMDYEIAREESTRDEKLEEEGGF